MARYNEILTGRYNRFIQKLFQMKGNAPAPQLAGDISIALTLFNGVENRYLEGWELFGQSVIVAGVAAVPSAFNLRNPAGSNVIAVIEKLAIGAGSAESLILSVSSTGADLATLGTGQARGDTRQRGISTCIPSSVASAAAVSLGGPLGSVFAGPNSYDWITFDDQEIILVPSMNMRVVGGTINTSLFVCCFWRERFLEESERT